MASAAVSSDNSPPNMSKPVGELTVNRTKRRNEKKKQKKKQKEFAAL